jgi:hypothetical protein
MRNAMVRRIGTAALLALALAMGGCATRSISDSGYPGRQAATGISAYRGELSEFDVLGIDLADPATDEDIARQLERHRRVVVHSGAQLLVIQSGAPLPDDGAIRALERDFSVVPFSGVPAAQLAMASNTAPTMQHRGTDYARALRLVAAKAGAETILCYWGTLETLKDREPTKAISWVPIVGSVIPDETQHMRIRLQVAVIDVKSGSWSMFAPEADVDSSVSTSLHREASDQGQVALLKEKAYKAAADTLLARYVE